MKVTGDVEIINRLLSSSGSRSKGRCSRAQVGIGHVGSGASKQSAMLICTQQDRSGTKYMLENNIECVFTKFVHEGKCTIRLREPTVDVCISKTDPVQLKGFLVLLKTAVSGKTEQRVALAPLLPASRKQIAKLKTKMVISSRSEYPVISEFPHGLEALSIKGCSLKRVELRILRLSKLVTLDLSNNCISMLPDDWSALKCLAELKLAKNSLTHLPANMFSRGQLSAMAHLDLSENQLSSLPNTIVGLLHLAVLKIDANKLTSLPQGFGRLQKLFQFTASGNQLAVLPGDFDRLALQNLDLFGNPIMDIGQPAMTIMEEVGFPSLLELSARSIKNFRVPYSPADVGRRLAEALDDASVCWKCGGACLTPCAQYDRSIDLRQVSASVTAIDLLGRTRAACSGLLCSASCVLRVQNERDRV